MSRKWLTVRAGLMPDHPIIVKARQRENVTCSKGPQQAAEHHLFVHWQGCLPLTMNRWAWGSKFSALPLLTQFSAQHTEPLISSLWHPSSKPKYRPTQSPVFQNMSGFEIAGIILGSLPLVISALEHYKSGKSVASALVQWRGHLDTLIHRLKQQDILFFLSLRDLLHIAGVQELSAGRLDLTREECAKIFSFPETEEAMKESLGFLHETILDTLRRYEECLKKIVVKIRHIQRLDGVSVTFCSRLLFSPLAFALTLFFYTVTYTW